MNELLQPPFNQVATLLCVPNPMRCLVNNVPVGEIRRDFGQLSLLALPLVIFAYLDA